MLKLVKKTGINKKKFSQFSKKICKIFLRKTFTNFFFTVTNNRNKVLFTTTGGYCSNSNKRRNKLSPVTLIKMIDNMRNFLFHLGIKKLQIIIRSRLT